MKSDSQLNISNKIQWLLFIFLCCIITSFLSRHVEVSDCGHFLIVCPQEGCRDNLVYFANIDNMSKDGGINSALNLSQVVHEFKHDYEVCLSYIWLLNIVGHVSFFLILKIIFQKNFFLIISMLQTLAQNVSFELIVKLQTIGWLQWT